ncbi:MAG: PhoX family protein [Betaproteobacteria bacterium]
MKGSLHPTNDVSLNPSGNTSIHDVIEATDPGRRRFLRTTVSASLAAAFGGVSMTGIVNAVQAAPIASTNGFAGIGFEGIAAKTAVNASPASSASPPRFADTVDVPPGYKVELFAAWGDPVMPGASAWLPDATQGASEQLRQFGLHNDGMHFFGFPARTASGATGVASDRGLLCVNHEYTHEAILHGPSGNSKASVTIQKVRKSQAAHGVSVLEARRTGGKWGVVANSPFGRRITANTPMRIAGPAAGNALMRAKNYTITDTGSAENGVSDGRTCQGTFNNCAHGYTPWGTYLTCEENWNGYFGAKAGFTNANDFNRYGVTATGFSSDANYWWHEADARFDVVENPLEPNRHGYVVEIDPFNPQSTPVKRTALGRFKHESAQVAVSADAQGGQNRVAFYMGDDERNEYIYKFVCTRSFDPRNRAANLNLLDEGILYVARFTSTQGAGANTFRGVWIPLVPDTETVIDNPGGGKYRLRDLPDFSGGSDADVQGRICIRTRQAADAVGATMMDRPEWTALRTYFDPQQGTQGYATYNAQRPLEVYCTLTNNNRRGGGSGTTPATSSNNPNGTTAAGGARPPVDVANPRPDNDYGHIIRWREDGNFVTATGFEWDIFMLCGDNRTSKTLAANYFSTNLVPGSGSGPFYQGDIVDTPDGSADLGAPDGLWFDNFGRMWIQTDQVGDGSGDWVNIGSNVMACADPNTKQVRRFLTSPPNCEVTGVVTTPDGKTMWVGIQHPGEDSPAADPPKFSNWPRSQFAANSAGQPVAGVHPVDQSQLQQSRPRSSVLVITRDDGGVIGGL